MGLENIDIIAILALALSFITFIFALYHTRKIGPMIDLFHAKLRGDGFVHNGKTFYIGVSVYAENYGDKATDLILEPVMTVFDDQNQRICSTKDFTLYDKRFELTELVLVSNPIKIEVSGYLPLKAEEWKKVEIDFNAHYFRKKFLRKKWKKIIVKNNKFTLNK